MYQQSKGNSPSGWSDQARRLLGDDFWTDIFGVAQNNYGPRTDIYETDGMIVLLIELPGIRDLSEIELDVESNRVSVRGMKKNKYEDAHVIQSEMFYGNFDRTISLPSPVREDKVHASFYRGVLEIKLFRKNRKPRSSQRIQIQNHD